MWTVEQRQTHDRAGLRYPSDLPDAERALVEPLLPPARRGGRRRTVDVRAVLDGIFYVLATGCQWRALPEDLPPRSTVHDYLTLWPRDRTLGRLHHALFVQAREQAGKEASPTAAIIDSQSVKGGLPPDEWRDGIRTSRGRAHDDPFHAGPGLGRGPVAQGRVQPLPVVEHFHVLEHRGPGLRAAAEADVVDVLLLERGEEGLHRRVVQAVPAPAHRLLDAVPLQRLAVGLSGVLHAAIRVVNEPRLRPAALQGPHQGVGAELGPEVVGHGPADDLARSQVLDDGRVEPALVGRQVADVGQ